MAENEITRTVGKNISTARKNRGMTQKKLAEAIKHSETSVRFWETGRREIGHDSLIAVSNALGYKWLWFYQHRDEDGSLVASEPAPKPTPVAGQMTDAERFQAYLDYRRMLGDGDSLTVCKREDGANFNNAKNLRTLLAPRLAQAQNAIA